MKIRHSEPHGPRRKAAYPDIGDQLDAVFKMAKALAELGIQLPDETMQWIHDCERIKRAYKKAD